MDRKLIWILSILLLISLVIASENKFRYNPYTAKHDYYLTYNESDFINSSGGQFSALLADNRSENVNFGKNITAGQCFKLTDTETICSDSANRVDIHWADTDIGMKFHSGTNEMFDISRFSGGAPTLSRFTVPVRYYWYIGGSQVFEWRATRIDFKQDSYRIDNRKSIFGTGNDARMYYDNTNLIIDPDNVGTGAVLIGATGDDDLVAHNISLSGGIISAENSTFKKDVIIDGNLYGGSPLNIGSDTIISKNLSVSGNITSENVFIPQYIFSHTNRTMQVLGANTWTNVTFDQDISTDIKYGIVHVSTDNTNQTFTIMEDGIYESDFDFDIEDDSPGASQVDLAGRLIFVNGTEVVGSVFETDLDKNGEETELSHDFLFMAKAGNQFVFQFAGTDAQVQISTHGVFGDYPESATVVIKKVANL